MKTVLIAYPAMMLGGSTTSLLSILENIDYSKYKVSLALAFYMGEWMDDIPEKVELLKPTYLYQDKKSRYIHRLLSPKFMKAKIESEIMAFKEGNPVHSQQYLGMKDVDFYRDLDEEYDVAIAFLEGQTCKYVANHVRAKKKIAWIHVDYKDSRRCAEYDMPSLSQYDKIVHVSDKCYESFCEMFPCFKHKSCVIENILSQNRIKKIAEEKDVSFSVNKNCCNIVTTCRLTYYQKGLDRAINAFAEIYKSDKNLQNKLHWYIIGGGPDKEKIENQITEAGLQNMITLLGTQKNPYQFYENMDCFFLPSRYEGKPMAVTEALMLDLPVVVTEYLSAKEQIKDNIEGKIFENSDNGTKLALEFIIKNPVKLKEMKKYISSKDYSNFEEMKKIEDIIDF